MPIDGFIDAYNSSLTDLERLLIRVRSDSTQSPSAILCSSVEQRIKRSRVEGDLLSGIDIGIFGAHGLVKFFEFKFVFRLGDDSASSL